MNFSELGSYRTKLENMDAFKELIEEVLYHELHFKKHGGWLSEEYTEHNKSDVEDSTNYRAVIVCPETTYRDDFKFFKHGYDDVYGVTIYDVFYTDCSGGGFVTNRTSLDKDAIMAIKKLTINKTQKSTGC